MASSMVIWLLLLISVGQLVVAQQSPGIVIAHPGQDVELLCTVTVTSASQAAAWLLNNVGPYSVNALANGIRAGYSADVDNNNLIVQNIVMNDVRNGSEYRCVIVPAQGTPSFADITDMSDPIILYIVARSAAQTTTRSVYLTTSSLYPTTTVSSTTLSSSVSTITLSSTLTVTSSRVSATSITVTTSSGASTTISTTVTPTVTPIRVPATVPGVTVDNNTININEDNVTLTLSWEEPFNNLDSIMNYTVSCSGDVTCPPNFTTTDNTTRSYTITNLTPMTNYTFSVVATNSIGSGEAGVVMITTPPAINQVTGVTVTCKPVGLDNLCTVMWNPITQGDITGYQVYNGTMMNVNSSTTTLTFTAPSLPDGGVFSGTVVVMVTAINQFGVGPASDPINVIVTASSVTNATAMLNAPNAINELHSITVTCTIHPNSTADQCVVMAIADGRATNTTGKAPIINGMAIVTVISLHCGLTYDIAAQGMYNNGTLVGPVSFYRNITTGVCPNMDCESDDDDDDDDGLSTELVIVISVVGTFIITLVITALITCIIASLYHKHQYDKLMIKDFKEVLTDTHVDNKNGNMQKKSPCEDNSYENVTTIKMTKVAEDTEPAYEIAVPTKVDTSDVHMDANPAYALSNL